MGASLDRAYRACEQMAKAHYENFPVASWLAPRDLRPHIAALYAFARVADDIADEGAAPPDRRRAELSRWQQQLHAAVDAEGWVPSASRDDLILAALAHTIRSRSLPLALFDDLLSAFAQDTTTSRYASWDELLDYCRRSANPVGRLVLLMAGHRSESIARASDCVCTALQLTNFWQDLGRDWSAGRLYVPRAIADAAAANEADLHDQRWTPAWSDALARCIAHTRDLFTRGRPVCDAVAGRLRIELRVTWLGGMRVLDRVEAGRDRALISRPTLGVTDVPGLLWQAMRWEGAAA